MSSIFSNDHKFNMYTHLVFPARTYLKDIIYWTTEIAAAIILLVYVFGMDLTASTSFSDRTRVLKNWHYMRAVENYGTHQVKIVDTFKLPFVVRGKLYHENIGYGSSNTGRFNFFPSALENQEYAWIAMLYMIKHLVYLIDTFLIKKNKKAKADVIPLDFLGHFLNFAMWLLWAVFGWTCKDEEIHIGYYTRWMKDIKSGARIIDGDKYVELQQQRRLLTLIRNFYISFSWLYIVMAILFIVFVILFIFQTIKKRSSAYHGMALSTLVISGQLFLYHLFLRGEWISASELPQSNINRYKYAARYHRSDYFEPRWVFALIYVASWGGLLLAVANVFKGFSDISKNTKQGVKSILYAALFVVCYAFGSYIDGTLYNRYINYRTELLILLFIGIVIAILIGIISIGQKNSECYNYFTRHNSFAQWGVEQYGQTVAPGYAVKAACSTC